MLDGNVHCCNMIFKHRGGHAVKVLIFALFLFLLFSRSVRNIIKPNYQWRTLYKYESTRDWKTPTQRSVILIKFYYTVCLFFMYMRLYEIRKSEGRTIKLIFLYFIFILCITVYVMQNCYEINIWVFDYL